MGKGVGGVALLLLALFMCIGYLSSDSTNPPLATAFAFLITVILPAGAGAALLRAHYRGYGRLDERREALRRQTMESEILRLAGERDGKLTVVELVTTLALPSDQAKELLDGLVTREIADVQISETGMLVYAFPDIRRLGEKSGSKGVLDA